MDRPRLERPGRRVRPSPLDGAAAIVLSLAVATGLVVGVRSVVALELPGLRSLLRLPSLPVEPLGLPWSSRVVWAHELQDAALERMAALLAALLLAAASVALLSALALLVEASTARRRELAVRAAVGAGPGALVALLARQLRVLLGTGVSLGLLLGLTAGAALRGGWPGVTEAVGPASALASLAVALAALLGVAASGYLWMALAVGRRGALAPVLASGARVSSDRAEAFRRRALSAFQMGMAGALTVGAWALALSVGTPEGPPAGSGDTVAVAVSAPGGGPPDWAGLLAMVSRVDGMDSATLASPGALVGLGVRDNALAQCGACYRGGLPLYLWGVRADHHAVGPGFFDDVGVPVVEGRGFTPTDGVDAPRVAVVNRTFANTAFENGRPLGRSIRLGGGLDGWYEVVGVVEDHDPVAVGRDDLARPVVYVGAFQHPLSVADVLLRGEDSAVEEAVAVLERRGLRIGVPRALDEVAREAAAPLAWLGRLSLVVGALTLLLALHGAHATALQVARRRMQEVAVRRVLGATDRRVLAHVLGASARTGLAGAGAAVFFGTLLVAVLRKAAGGVTAPGVGAYLAVTAALVGVSLVAAARAAGDSLAVAPARALE